MACSLDLSDRSRLWSTIEATERPATLCPHILLSTGRCLMQGIRASLKPGIWGALIGSILTMIVGFSWGGWTTSSTAGQTAAKQADAAVTAALVPVCLAGEKA